MDEAALREIEARVDGVDLLAVSPQWLKDFRALLATARAIRAERDGWERVAGIYQRRIGWLREQLAAAQEQIAAPTSPPGAPHGDAG